MNLWLALALAILSITPAASPHKAAHELAEFYPVGRPGEITYIDSTGKLVLGPIPGDAMGFGRGQALARVKHVSGDSAGYGLMDRTGRLVANEIYEEAHAPEHGLSLVRRDGKFGFVNDAGDEAIATTFDDAASFGFLGGFAAVSISAGWGYIDTTGSVVIMPRYDAATSFAEDRAAVRQDAGYGFIDRTGRMVVAPRFANVYAFSEGVAAVMENDRWYYIDRNGERAFAGNFADAQSFSEGVAAVTDTIGTPPRFIDHHGRTTIADRYQRVGPFRHGLACVQRDDLWGWIDHQGRVAIPITYAHVSDFSGALARIEDANYELVGYVNVKGGWVWRRTAGKAEGRH